MGRMQEFLAGLKSRTGTALHQAARRLGMAGYNKDAAAEEELKEKVGIAQDLVSVRSTPGWKHLFKHLEDRRNDLVQVLLHGDDREKIDGMGVWQRAAEVDALLRWPEEAILEGERASRQLEESNGNA